MKAYRLCALSTVLRQTLSDRSSPARRFLIFILSVSFVPLPFSAQLQHKAALIRWTTGPIRGSKNRDQSAQKHGRRTFLYSAVEELVCN